MPGRLAARALMGENLQAVESFQAARDLDRFERREGAVRLPQHFEALPA